MSSSVSAKPECPSEICFLFVCVFLFVCFYTEMGNIQKKLPDSQPKPYFYFCCLRGTNVAKSLLIHSSNIFFQRNFRETDKDRSLFLQELAVGHTAPQQHQRMSKTRVFTLFSLLSPFPFSGYLFQVCNNPNKFSSADLLPTL